MPTIADYVLIYDDVFTIENKGSFSSYPSFWSKTFSLDSGANLSKKPILAFVLISKKNAEGKTISFEVRINGVIALSYKLGGLKQTVVNTIHEVIGTGTKYFTGAKNNRIEFIITGGEGKLQFGDIVLHYKRTV